MTTRHNKEQGKQTRRGQTLPEVPEIEPTDNPVTDFYRWQRTLFDNLTRLNNDGTTNAPIPFDRCPPVKPSS